ncbi:MAG: hypothetical protein MRJ68_08550 [Nitrospira sp.]|nr:hypothetical protein [Nitrospira sp.]
MDLPPDIKKLHQEISEKRLAFSALIKKAYAPNALSTDKYAAQAASNELISLDERIRALIDDHLMAAGLTQEQLDELDEEFQAELNTTIEQDLSIGNYTPATVTPTTEPLEKALPMALEKLLSIVSPRWLDEERKKSYRLEGDHITKPFSLISGMRSESVQRPIHRFAQGLLVSQDYIEGREDYDFYAGALLAPQTAQLGTVLDVLTDQVQGDVRQRIASLSTGESDLVDSTIFELLVAAACSLNGRKIEMLSHDQQKTPDIRVTDHVMPMPTVIECKRRRFVSEYERSEEARLKAIFQTMVHVFRRKGAYGIIEVEFLVEITAVPIDDFVSACSRIALYGLEGVAAKFEWGSVKFFPLAKKIDLEPTRLYSPSYLKTVFNWSGDVSEFDGLVCESLPRGGLTTNMALEPVSIKWRSRSTTALSKKQRAIGALFGDAIGQIPDGELGIIYLCYQEGSTADIANQRTQRIQQEFSRWGHRGAVSIPGVFVNRLYARVLGEGNPDLIENVILMKPSDCHPSIFELFPAEVFTAT